MPPQSMRPCCVKGQCFVLLCKHAHGLFLKNVEVIVSSPCLKLVRTFVYSNLLNTNQVPFKPIIVARILLKHLAWTKF